MPQSIVSNPSPSPDADLEAARRVLRLAGDALSALSQSLDVKFSQALDVLAGVKGRVVVSGMGKSGHVGRKIAATMSSTGTPAQFVHPAEASHGDLGMLAQGDALVMLSNSGETAELSDLLTYAKRFSIPVIGIASNADSALMRASDVPLLLPKAQEACSIGMAPTTSTTLMIALGDALAVALMERKGFSADHYRDLHPAGALGRALIRVSDLMHTKIPVVTRQTAMKDVLMLMTSFREYGFAGVVGVNDEGGNLVGVITDGDLRRNVNINAQLLDRQAGEVMTKNPKTVQASTLGAEALAIMNEIRITSLFVVADGEDGGAPVGLLHIHDCLRAGLR
jgi:arabinose-5-phosphate isomerase